MQSKEQISQIIIQYYPLKQQEAIKLAEFLQLLLQWNKTFNLTSITNMQEAIIKHIIDCSITQLAVDKIQHSSNWVDVGAGGGLPGIVLAILYPHIQFTLVDAVAKKTKFLEYIKLILKLDNIRILHGRVETVTCKFDVISSRAFANLQNFVDITMHLSHNNTSWFAMKGKNYRQEIISLENKFNIDVVTLDTRDLLDDRFVLLLTKT